jgi:tetratricopeptide (TPR) repeat protein
MKAFSLAALVLAVLAFPGVVAAQTAAIQKEIEGTLQQARMYEDIEIMRRLLQRKLNSLVNSCSSCHPHPFLSGFGEEGGGGAMMMGPGGMPGGMGGIGGGMGSGMPSGMPGIGPPMGMAGMNAGAMHPGGGRPREDIAVEAVYLPGYGAVFQAQASALSLPIVPPAGAAGKPAPPLSEWEIIRRQLRGEKSATTPPHSDQHHKVSFQETLLATLAEHGKHFRALGDKEKLVVAITFRTAPTPEGMMSGMGGPPGAGPGPDGGGDFGGGSGAVFPMGGSGGSSGGSPPGGFPGEGGDAFGPKGGRGGAGSGSSAPPSGRNTSKDHELLADYHLKQARYQDAARALLKAISLNTDAARVSGLQRKLAIAYLMQDQYQNADADAVAKAFEAFKKAVEGKKTDAAPAPPPVLLPQRLIVSASRQALQASSPDEFRRLATAELIRFNHPVLRGAIEAAP